MIEAAAVIDIAIREDAVTITVVISTLTDEFTAERTAEDVVRSIAVMTVDPVRDSRRGNRDERYQEGRCLERGDHGREETLAMDGERREQRSTSRRGIVSR